jgi:uncharacterized membrane protein
MKISIKRPFIDILLSLLYCIIFLPIALLNVEHIIRIILGIPFILFIPGYLLILILFPLTKRKTSIDTIERLALSFSLSLAIISLIGLGLNYTEWGLELVPIIISLILFNFVIGIIALYCWYRFPLEQKVFITFTWSFPKNKKNLDFILTLILIASVILATISLTYVFINPKLGKSFSEFYILGPNYKLEGYQTNLVIKEETNVIIGIVNHEYKTINYTVEIWLLDQTIKFNKFTNKFEIKNNHLWFFEKINTSLNYLPVNIDEPWIPQWELNFSFNISKKGEFKLFFLLYTSPTAYYSKNIDYIAIWNQKINSAYRATNLSVSVSSHPKLFNIFANPISSIQNGFINISCSVFDADGIDNVYLNIIYPDYTNENFSIIINKTGFTYYCNRTYATAGNYYYNVWSNDTTGNGSISDFYSFLITDIPKIPDVWTFPLSIFIGGYLNISCLVYDNDKINEVCLNISYPNGHMENFSIISNKTGLFFYYCNKTYDIVGNYSYYIWVNDSVGNTNTTNVFYFSVQDYPWIGKIKAIPPNILPNGFINISCSVYDIDGIDDVILEIKYPDNTIKNFSITSNKSGLTYYFNKTFINVGIYNYTIWAYSITGDLSKSSTYQFIVSDYPGTPLK